MIARMKRRARRKTKINKTVESGLIAVRASRKS
jgi:hypothetical protein